MSAGMLRLGGIIRMARITAEAHSVKKGFRGIVFRGNHPSGYLLGLRPPQRRTGRIPAMDSDITRMLKAASSGGTLPSEDLLPLVYDELRRLASAGMKDEAPGQTIQPTALVHEAWLRLAGKDQRLWNDRSHFFRTAAQVMRRILVDRARQKSRIKRGSGATRIDISEIDLVQSTPDDRILLINEVLDRLERENPDAAQIITMKFFGGLTNLQIAEALGISERSVDRRWNYAKASLFLMIREEI